jgi:hypothetical protein
MIRMFFRRRIAAVGMVAGLAIWSGACHQGNGDRKTGERCINESDCKSALCIDVGERCERADYLCSADPDNRDDRMGYCSLECSPDDVEDVCPQGFRCDGYSESHGVISQTTEYHYFCYRD